MRRAQANPCLFSTVSFSRPNAHGFHRLLLRMRLGPRMQKPVPGLSGHCECHVNATGEIDPKGDLFLGYPWNYHTLRESQHKPDIQRCIETHTQDELKPTLTSMMLSFARTLKCFHVMTFYMLWAPSIGGEREREQDHTGAVCILS